MRSDKSTFLTNLQNLQFETRRKIIDIWTHCGVLNLCEDMSYSESKQYIVLDNRRIQQKDFNTVSSAYAVKINVIDIVAKYRVLCREHAWLKEPVIIAASSSSSGKFGFQLAITLYY